jgi:AAA domain
MSDAYPEGFHAWPPDRRNAFFADEARAYNEKVKRSNRGDKADQARAEAKSSRIRLKSASTFCSEYTPLSYAVEPFIRSSSLYTLTAKTGAGKTALLVIMALAIAANRGDILGREVTKGRVVYYSPENPDDLRMRLMVAAFVLGIDLDELLDDLVILDKRVKPEDLEATLHAEAARIPIALVIVDTLQAAFDGADLNDNVQSGEFMRRLRRLTTIKGLPSIIVAAHPVKNAANDNLLPYGGGAMLNEVDGNLTLCATGAGLTSLHWQGKLRGIDFTPALFRFEILDCPDVLDIKGQRVALPVLRPTTEEEGESREKAAVNRDVTLLMALAKEPRGSMSDWAAAASLTKAAVQRGLGALAKKKLVEKILDKWALTPAGRKAIKDRIESDG